METMSHIELRDQAVKKFLRHNITKVEAANRMNRDRQTVHAWLKEPERYADQLAILNEVLDEIINERGI